MLFAGLFTGLTSLPTAQAENPVSNANFENHLVIDTVITTTTPEIPTGAVAQFWQQTLRGGTFVETRMEDSDDVLAGSTSKMMRVITDSPGFGAAGTTITTPLSTPLPPGAKGGLDVRIISGSARIGFLRVDGASGEFLPGSVLVTGGGPGAAWQHVSFSSTGTASVLGIRLLAPGGGQADIYMDNAVAIPAPVVHTARYDYIGHFGPMGKRINGFCYGNEVPLVGDFNGDGLDDLVTFWKNTRPESTGRVQVAFNYSNYYSSGGFQFNGYEHPYFCVGNEIPGVGDFDGDSRDDIISFDPGNGKVWVALADRDDFALSREWYDTETYGVFMDGSGQTPLVGDFNGDGRDDVALFTHGSQGFVFVAINNGRGFGPRELWMSGFCTGTAVPRVGDVNGDGRDDIVSFIRNSQSGETSGDVEVALAPSAGSSFAFTGNRFWHRNFAPTEEYEPLLADLNGDGCADIIAVHNEGQVYAAIATGLNSFGTGEGGTETAYPFWQWHHDARNPNEKIFAGRFNGDLNADLALFVRSERAADPADDGAVFTSLGGGHAQPEPHDKLADFGWQEASGITTWPATRPLAVLISQVVGTPPLTRTTAEYEQGIFGPAHPNLVSWIDEMSKGYVTITRGGLVSYPLDESTIPPGFDPYRFHMELAANTDGPGGFEFKNFDTDSNGIVDVDELRILAIASEPPGAGKAYWADTVIFPDDPARRVHVRTHWAYSGGSATLANMVHEVCHGFGMVDTYGGFSRGALVSLASATAGTNNPTYLLHPDPYNKMRMGWTTPLIYDIAHFPAGKAIAPAQEPSSAPVILYDSSRGTHEYHMVEHRNRDYQSGTTTWTPPGGGTWRPKPRSFYPSAGYDIDVQDTLSGSNLGVGFAVWAVKTHENHDAWALPIGIRAGTNGVLESVRAGDDALWEDPAGVDPPQIYCGTNSILDTPALGDDEVFEDSLILPMSNPADIPARFHYTLHPDRKSLTTLQYYDGSDSGVMVKADEPHGDYWQYVEWGKAFRPFIQGLYTPAVATIGEGFLVVGDLGDEQLHEPLLIGPGGFTIKPTIASWSGTTATFTIPAKNFPSGNYRFALIRRSGPTDTSPLEISSNSFEMNLRNGFDEWRSTHFPEDQLDDAATSADGDYDKDGISNFVEWVLFKDPMVPDQMNLESYEGWSGDFMATSVSARREAIGTQIKLEYSYDLQTWGIGRTHTISPSLYGPGSIGMEFFLYHTDPPSYVPTNFFYRLKFIRPAY